MRRSVCQAEETGAILSAVVDALDCPHRRIRIVGGDVLVEYR